MIIDDLFDSLGAPQPAQPSAEPREQQSPIQPQRYVYGKEILASEDQVKSLVALSHVFPNRLTNAIAAIESGHCAQYCHANRHIWVVELVPVCLPAWVCSCKDFASQLSATPPGSSRWKRACKHLLAGYLLEHRYPILSYSSVRTVDLSLDQFAELSLEGPIGLEPPSKESAQLNLKQM